MARQTAKLTRQWHRFVTRGGGEGGGGWKTKAQEKGKNNLQLYFETLPWATSFKITYKQLIHVEYWLGHWGIAQIRVIKVESTTDVIISVLIYRDRHKWKSQKILYIWHITVKLHMGLLLIWVKIARLDIGLMAQSVFLSCWANSGHQVSYVTAWWATGFLYIIKCIFFSKN